MTEAFIFTTQVPPRTCPVCGRALDGSTGVSLDPKDRQPVMGIGDVTCCAYCGTLLSVTTIGFRLATDDDLASIDPALRTLLFAFSLQHGGRSRM